MSKDNTKKDKEEVIYRIKYKKNCPSEDSSEDDDVRYSIKYKATKSPKLTPRITPEKDEEIFTFDYHTSSNFRDHKILIIRV